MYRSVGAVGVDVRTASEGGLVVTALPVCPSCDAGCSFEIGVLVCEEGHRYTSLGLALATNVGAVNAVWRAVRALEDDAAGLDWLASREAVNPAQAQKQREEAAGAREAAGQLRTVAGQAQRRLEALPALTEDDRSGSS